jgi:membrane associated rhomboid family serine protease
VKNYLSKKLFSVSFYPLIFISVLWIIFFIQQNSNFNPSRLGVLPREVKGLHGIVTSVLVHSNLDHILSNSFPILILGMMLFFFYEKIAKQAFMWIWLISGIWLWIGGRNSGDYPIYHLGASTLIYGLATFLFFSGVFRRHLRLMVVSALVVFLYGSIMWGIFPLKEEISWEGHLFGAIAGSLVAYNYRTEGPQRKVYEWENDSEDDNENGGPNEEIGGLHQENEEDLTKGAANDLKINYVYKKNVDFGDSDHPLQ